MLAQPEEWLVRIPQAAARVFRGRALLLLFSQKIPSVRPIAPQGPGLPAEAQVALFQPGRRIELAALPA